MMRSCSSRELVPKMFAVIRMINQRLDNVCPYQNEKQTLLCTSLQMPVYAFGNPRWAKESESAMKASTFV